MLAIETIPCLAEVEAVLAELSGTGHPAWLSLTAAGAATRAGEPLAEAFATAVRTASELSGVTVSVIHIVGGGSLNTLLCQRTADRSGLPDDGYSIRPLLDLADKDERDHGLGDLPYPPEYPKMPGEPKRVQPSKDRDLKG